ATAGLAVDNPASLRIMAAVMAAGMVPPLAMGLATVVRSRLFSRAERENGRAAFLLGASFISEGAIPFAAADPLRVIPSMMAGGAVTGALIMAFSVESYAPHGGIFVFFAINPVWGYIVAILAGMLVGTVLVVIAKSARRDPAPAAEPAALAAGSTTGRRNRTPRATRRDHAQCDRHRRLRRGSARPPRRHHRRGRREVRRRHRDLDRRRGRRRRRLRHAHHGARCRQGRAGHRDQRQLRRRRRDRRTDRAGPGRGVVRGAAFPRRP